MKFPLIYSTQIFKLKIEIMIRYILIITILLLPASRLTAQPGQMQRGRGGFEQVEAERIAFITKYLELTSDEAKRFWPVYDDFRNRRDQLVQERHNSSRYFQQNYQNLGEKEAEELADKYIALQLREARLTEDYHKKFKEVIPPVKVMRLYEAENVFRMQLLRRVRGGQGAGRGTGSPPGGGR